MARGRARISGRARVDTRAKAWRIRAISGTPQPQDAMIQVGTNVYALVDRLAQDSANKAAAVITNDMLAFFREIQRQWPRPGNDTSGRSTGYSYSQLGLKIEQVGNTLVASITNAAFYAGYIRQDDYGGEGLVKRIVFDPADEVAAALVRTIGDQLARS